MNRAGARFCKALMKAFFYFTHQTFQSETFPSVQSPPLPSALTRHALYMTNHVCVSTGTHRIKATVFVFVSDFHGHRRLADQSVAGQRHLRVDRRPFPVLQECADRLEEQRPAQPIIKQVFPKSRKSTRKHCFFYDLKHYQCFF